MASVDRREPFSSPPRRGWGGAEAGGGGGEGAAGPRGEPVGQLEVVAQRALEVAKWGALASGLALAASLVLLGTAAGATALVRFLVIPRNTVSGRPPAPGLPAASSLSSSFPRGRR